MVRLATGDVRKPRVLAPQLGEREKTRSIHMTLDHLIYLITRVLELDFLKETGLKFVGGEGSSDFN